MSDRPSREHLLETCFSEIPQKIGSVELRPLSAGSFTLLGRLGNPMMGGTGNDNQTLFEAVLEYVWIHSAPLDRVIAIEFTEDIPTPEIKKLGFEIPMGEALAFLPIYARCAKRMAAALAELDPEDDDTPGKPADPERAPAGSPPSSMPSAAVPIPPGSDTYSGFSASSAPSATSMRQTSPTEPAVDGLVMLPDWTPVDPEPTQS